MGCVLLGTPHRDVPCGAAGGAPREQGFHWVFHWAETGVSWAEFEPAMGITTGGWAARSLHSTRCCEPSKQSAASQQTVTVGPRRAKGT